MHWVDFVVSGAVGAGIFSGWRFLARTVLSLDGFRRLHGEEEDALRELLRRGADRGGVFVVPGLPRPRTRDRRKQAAIDEVYRERLRTGPVATIAVRPRGSAPAPVRRVVVGLAIDALAAISAVAVLALATPESYAARWFVVVLVGVAGWASTHATNWNESAYPAEYTLRQLASTAVGWTLLGLWLAPRGG